MPQFLFINFIINRGFERKQVEIMNKLIDRALLVPVNEDSLLLTKF